MIYLQMAFPPSKEGLYVPAKFIYHGDLLSCEIIAVGGNPVIYIINPIPFKAKLFLRLIYPWGSKKDYGIVEDNALRVYFVSFDHFFIGISPDAAYKMFSLLLPLIKVLMALVVTIQNTCLSR